MYSTLKIFVVSLVLVLLLDSPVQAETKYYQYNGNLPFVEMMLNMMVVMGMLDKVPPQMMGDGRQNYLTRQLLLNNALLKRQDLRLSGMNPYALNSMRLNPYGMNFAGLNAFSLNPTLSRPWFSSPLSRYDRSSPLNNYSDGHFSPLARLYRRQNRARYYANSSINNAAPCVTEYCGLLPGSAGAIARLNGAWVTRSGEMLGIKSPRFLWSDGKSRYLTGNIKVLPNTLVASVDGSGRVMRFSYRLENGRLLTQDTSGKMRVFRRMPAAGI